MNSGALLIIASDPRASGRPAEAVRLAAGLGPWRKVAVTVYLRGPAVLILGENAEELVDGENFARFLPALGELGHPLYAQKGAAMLPGPGPATLPFEEISDAQLAAMAAGRSLVLRF
jgi:hypothetical protein